MKSKKILLADAQALVYIGQSHLLSGSAEYEVKGFVRNSEELRLKVKEDKPDVLIIDFHYPGVFSTDDIREVYAVCPETRILVVTSSENTDDVKKLLGFGVKNYILKKCSKEEFLFAVQATTKGERYLCNSVEKLLDKQLKSQSLNTFHLSEREIEIVELISRGFSSKEIAVKLHLSEYTIGTHRKNILKKLQISKSSELVMFAVKAGLITAGS